MIHALGWAAVILQAAHSYRHRQHLDPHGVLEHRAGLPAVAFAVILLFILAVLIEVTGVGGVSVPAAPPAQKVIWVPVA